MKKLARAVRQKASQHKRQLFIGLVLISILEVIVVAQTGLLKEVLDVIPAAVFLSAISEALFLLGIAIMAYSAEQKLGSNPLKWRKRLPGLINSLNINRLFIIGFWVNFVGALGTGVIWLIVILATLPPSGWLLLWLPILDIFLTFALRKTFADLVSYKVWRKNTKKAVDKAEHELK